LNDRVRKPRKRDMTSAIALGKKKFKGGEKSGRRDAKESR